MKILVSRVSNNQFEVRENNQSYLLDYKSVVEEVRNNLASYYVRSFNGSLKLVDYNSREDFLRSSINDTKENNLKELNMEQIVFVYGTLKKGKGNHYILENSDFLGSFTTPPVYKLTCNSFFPMVEREGSTAVVGELYRVDQATLSRLNTLEGFISKGNPNNFYDIDSLETEFGEALIYVGNKGEGYDTVVESGNWKP